MKNNGSKIRGSQSDVISITLAAIVSCRKYLPRFAECSTLYTDAYLDDLNAQVNTASGTRAASLRRQSQVDARYQLTLIADANLSNSQLLKGYIERAAPQQQLNSWILAAGLGAYDKAQGYNWSALQGMVNTGSLFIADNLNTLTGKGYMPAAFPAKFNNDKQQFVEALGAFYEAESNKVVATESQTALYNNIFAEISAMFKDAQKIFANEESIRRQFVYDLLLSKLKSGGVAAIKGTIINIDTQQPIEGVNVYSAYETYSAVSDANGVFQISQLAADTYTLTFEKAGFETATETIEVKTGTTARADMSLQAIEFALKAA
jgi:hypothetical protein